MNEAQEKVIEKIKAESSGHEQFWQAMDLQTAINTVTPEFFKQAQERNVPKKVVLLGCSLFRIAFDQKELKGSVHYEVSSAIESAYMYYVNVLGEDI